MRKTRKRKKKTQKLLQVQTVAGPVFRRLREGSLILIMMLSLFMFVSLITYSTADPGWSKAATTTLIQNAAGKVGAWCSDLFLYLFGYIAYLFPFIVVIAGIRLLQKQQTESFSLPLGLLHFGGFLLSVAASCGLATLHFNGVSKNVPDDAGGVIGRMVGEYLVPVFNSLGSTLILFALFLIGTTLMTGLSWLHCLDGLGKGLLLASQKSSEGIRTILSKCLALWEKFREEKPQKLEPQLVSFKREEENVPSVQKREHLFVPEILENEATTNQPTRPNPSRVVTPYIKPEKVKIARSKKSTEALPDVALLESSRPEDHVNPSTPAFLESLSRLVENKLMDFGVAVKVVAVCPGPVITRFELELAAGLKVSKISALAKDLARALSVTRVRVVEVIPGKTVVGLEIPNAEREIVRLREIIESPQYVDSHSPISLALGKDIAGRPVVVDLSKMPHLLVAGTTGSGKSVGINMMLLSMLYKATPEDVRLILIDPKMLELSIYDGIAHLLTPVVTDMKDAANALRWCVGEMERRYQLMAALGVRNLVNFNQKVSDANKAGKPLLDPLYQPQPDTEPSPLQRLPYIVIIIDEFADMMMVVGKKVEELIARIAQKARAAGIHMILATQRPSVDVITGLIKANVPTRIAFQVSSRVDSRTILDQQGAEQLLGHGDMLYLPPGSGMPIRIHGAFVSDEEVHRVVNELKELGEPNFIEEILEGKNYAALGSTRMEGEEQDDELFDEAVKIVLESKRASISHLQRRLKIGYNRSARLIEMMESAGIVSSLQNNGMREVLASAAER